MSVFGVIVLCFILSVFGVRKMKAGTGPGEDETFRRCRKEGEKDGIPLRQKQTWSVAAVMENVEEETENCTDIG